MKHPGGFITLTEAGLSSALDEHDQLVVECATGRLDLEEFLAKYDDFYWKWALDGHESDEAGLKALSANRKRIALHRQLAEEVLGRLASEADAANPMYQQAGRIGPKEAALLLADLCTRHGLTGRAI